MHYYRVDRHHGSSSLATAFLQYRWTIPRLPWRKPILKWQADGHSIYKLYVFLLTFNIDCLFFHPPAPWLSPQPRGSWSSASYPHLHLRDHCNQAHGSTERLTSLSKDGNRPSQMDINKAPRHPRRARLSLTMVRRAHVLKEQDR